MLFINLSKTVIGIDGKVTRPGETIDISRAAAQSGAVKAYERLGLAKVIDNEPQKPVAKKAKVEVEVEEDDFSDAETSEEAVEEEVVEAPKPKRTRRSKKAEEKVEAEEKAEEIAE